MKKYQEILDRLPYSSPFLFVDELIRLDENGAEGTYRFREDEYFYQGHFKDQPVTPGVILTECMAQIGLVCLGVYLVRGSGFDVRGSEDKPGVSLSDSGAAGIVPARPGGGSKADKTSFVFTESHIIFEKAVFPGEEVRVVSRKKYWRLGKLKCEVEMFNSQNERLCHGTMSGMLR